jgi:hypothetical protein
MLNAPKPVHINIGNGTAASGVDATAANAATVQPPLYRAYEVVPAGGNSAMRINVPGMGAGADPAVGSKSTWRKASWITISNGDVTFDLQISFDNGNNFMTIGAGQTFTASLAFRHFFIRGVGAAATNIQVECIVGINGPN